jgi:hypothetical protein
MAGPILQIRATNFEKSDQANMLKMLERITVFEKIRDDYYEFHFKKGKTLGLNLKEKSCLFLMDIKEEDNETDDLELEDIASKIKDKPAVFITLSAMCNGKNDHHLLAAFALELVKILRGWIDLCGAINTQPIKGEIHEIRYRIDEIRIGYSHICDAKWLENWLQHDNFHLIK